MRGVRQRAFTLLELMVVLTVLGIVTAGLGRILVTSERLSQASAQRIGLRQGLRAAASVLPAEFRELDAADSDIIAMSATSITLRATRQLGFLCSVSGGGGASGLSLIIRQAPMYGERQSFDVGDSVLLYVEGDPGTRSDDAWVPGFVSGTWTDACPDPDRPRAGERLTVHLAGMADTSLATGRGITTGSPLRGFTVVTYAAYQSPSDHQWYLGQQVGAAAIQPLVGPLDGPTAFALEYADSAGLPTRVPTAVAEIEVRVRGRTTAPVYTAGGAVAYQLDSVVAQAALRNNPRCHGCP